MPHRTVARGTTLALLRRLRAPSARPRRRVGRIPKPMQPTAIEQSYTAAIHRDVCRAAREAFEAEAPEILAALAAHRRAIGQTDAAPIDDPASPRGRSRRLKSAARVALVLAFDPAGRLLLGRRRDTGRWTLPGGHLEPGESPRRGAARELEEETNLTARALTLTEQIDGDVHAGDVRIWLFRAKVQGTPTGFYDPDRECAEWRFFDVENGLPPDVLAMAAGPADPAKNILHRRFATRPALDLEAAAAVLEEAARLAGTPRTAPAIVPRHVRTALQQRANALGVRLDDVLPTFTAAVDILAPDLGRVVAEAAVDAAGEALRDEGVDATVTELVSAIRDAAGATPTRADSPLDEDRARGRRIGRAAAERIITARRMTPEPEAEPSSGSPDARRAAAALDRAARAFAEAFDPVALRQVVERFGDRTDEHSRRQLDQQLRSAIGVPLSALERPMRDRLSAWAEANVALVQTVPERYFDRLRTDVLDAFEGGTHPDTLAESMADRYGMAERDAERIARDQTLKLSADLTHGRMEALGVERATWRTVRDGRVCDECAPREGQEYRLDEGLEGILPGDCHPMDRCWSEPDLAPLLASD